MSLLTPSQAQAESRNQRVRQAARLKDASDALGSKQREMAETEAAFLEMLASQQVRWAKEEEEHENDVKERKAEIAVLEEKRMKALIPVENQRKEYEALVQAGKGVIAEYQKKQDHCDDLEEILLKRLDDASEMKERLADIANSLERRKGGIELQEKQSKENARLASETLERLRVEQVSYEARALKRDEQLNEKERELTAREMEQNERDALLDSREHRIFVLETMFNTPVNASPVRRK